MMTYESKLKKNTDALGNFSQ